MRTKLNYGAVLILIILMCLVSACSCFANNTRPTLGPLQSTGANLEQTTTPMPTYTPTLAPLGSLERPIVMAIVSAYQTPDQIQALADLGQQLGAAIGNTVSIEVFSGYLDLEVALQKKQVHLAWVQPVEYLLASQKQLLTSVLVANHLGVTAHGVQFVGHKDSSLVSWFDPNTNKSTASAAAALAQLSGLRPCLSSKSSLAGYWVPLGYLAINNIPILPPVETYSTSASLRTLNAKGVCDFAGTYAISADPRTASDVLADMPDAIEKLPILWVSPPVIPNLAFAISAEIDLGTRLKITEFFEQLTRANTGKSLVSAALNYEVATLEPLPDSAYDELRALLNVQDVRLIDLLPSTK